MPPPAPKLKTPGRAKSPGLKSPGKGRGRKLSLAGKDEPDASSEMDKLKVVLVKPPDQVQLTDAELKDEIIRVLTTTNPRIDKSVVRFSFKDRQYQKLVPKSHIINLVSFESQMLDRESEEAQKQLAGEEGEEAEAEEEPGAEAGEGEGEAEGEGEEGEAEGATEEEGKPPEEGAAEGEGEGGEEKAEAREPEEGEEEEAKPKAQPAGGRKGKKLVNQFNFSERAALASQPTTRTMYTQTEPPPRANFSGHALQWIIYDAYVREHEIQQREREKEMKLLPRQMKSKKRVVSAREDMLGRINLALKTIQRMVNQGIYDEISQDFRYWEDPSDEFQEDEGSLLPLWKFSYERTKKQSVTCLCWNPCYSDLFAASFGSYDFQQQVSVGTVCLFTLKDPSYPEYICTMPSGAMCVDVHPEFCSLLAVGLFDGNVAVFNADIPRLEPQYVSDSVSDKHVNTVWQVRWDPKSLEGETNFYSISSDGEVFKWVLMPKCLVKQTVITLYMSLDPIPGPDGTMIPLTGGGTSFAFHPEDDMIFLVGTEEGKIHKCSTAYASLYLKTWDAHYMPVYKLQWNYFIPNLFLSCSYDWRVKIWEDGWDPPLFVFDLGCPVGDAAWAPYSSTVFAAVTTDGRVHVFDLNMNKYKPLCAQPVVPKRKAKLTHIAFNKAYPIIIVGDNRGYTVTLKLSPNLRKKPKPPKKGADPITPFEQEVQKLEKLIALVREPKTLQYPPDKDCREL